MSERPTDEINMDHDVMDTDALEHVDEVSQEEIEKVQMKLDLFVAATDELSTNALQLYDSAPRFLHHQKIFEPQESAFQAVSFTVGKAEYVTEITAARIKMKEKSQATGQYEQVERIAFPGEAEQVVEDVLRKMATMHEYAHVFRGRIGVRFTLYALREECKKAGHEYNYTQLKHAITVLRGSNCRISNPVTGEVWDENYFSTLVRGGYRFNDGKREHEPWMITFHTLINESVLELSYRSMRYPRLMAIRNQLAKWLYKRMVNSFTYAEEHLPYSPTLVKMLTESGKGLSYRKDNGRAHNSNNLRAIKDAIESLVKVGVIASWDEQEDWRRKLDDGTVDRRFNLYPTEEFVKDQIKANAQLKARQKKAAQEKLQKLRKDL